MYRVVGLDECGEEIIVCDTVRTRERAEDIVEDTLEMHPEWRNCWIETHPYVQAMREGW